MTFYRLRKLAVEYFRDLTPSEIAKRKKDTLVFDGYSCVGNAFDILFKIKRKPRKTINNEIFEN